MRTKVKPNLSRRERREARVISPTDIYRMAYETRNLEINLFWQRCNYFLVLNSALALGYFNIRDAIYQFPVSILGLVVCMLWYRVALGSKYWNSRWEHVLREVEAVYIRHGYIEHGVELFSADPRRVGKDVAESIPSWSHGLFARIIANRVLTKPSVTLTMTMLVIVFIASWSLLLLYQIFVFAGYPFGDRF